MTPITLMTDDAATTEFALDSHTTRYSRTSVQIAGIDVFILGLHEALAFAQDISVWAVLHLVHPRTRTHSYSETLANLLLTDYYNDTSNKQPLIAVFFDSRNHGERMLSKRANNDWAEGNATHAQDMLSTIQGTAQDVDTVLRFLPAYLPTLLTNNSPETLPTRLLDIVVGVSQGGHVAWQVAASSTKPVKALVPVIATPYLTRLLLHRYLVQVKGFSSAAADAQLDALTTTPNKLLYHLSHADLERHLGKLTNHYPSHLHALAADMDRRVFESIDPKATPTLIFNSANDPLVPARFTTPWVAAHTSTTNIAEDDLVYEQPGVGHVCTGAMVVKISQFLASAVRTL